MFGIDLGGFDPSIAINPLKAANDNGTSSPGFGDIGSGFSYLNQNFSPMAGANRAASAAEQAGQAQVASAQQGINEAQTGVAMAQSEVAMAQAAVDNQIAQRQAAISQIQGMAALQPGEISQISQILSARDTQLSASLSSIAKQQSDLDSADPTVKAAGQNLYNLMTGKAADILAPMQQQQALQRQQLINNLSSTMGPGFATSTAGIQALTAFDQQSSLATAQAQLGAMGAVSQSYLGLYGAQQQGQNAVTSQTANAYQNAQSATDVALQANQQAVNRGLSGTIGAMQANQVNYALPTQAQQNVVQAQFGLVNAQQQMTGVAGNPFAGQAIQGNQQSYLNSQFFPSPAFAVGALFGKGGGSGSASSAQQGGGGSAGIVSNPFQVSGGANMSDNYNGNGSSASGIGSMASNVGSIA